MRDDDVADALASKRVQVRRRLLLDRVGGRARV